MIKNQFEIIFWSIFVNTFTWLGQKHDWVKNRFWAKITKNGQFSLNKGRKCTDRNKYLIKYKMITAYGFRINFQFQVQMSLPRDLQMDIASLLLWNGLALCLWDFWSRFLFPANFYAYIHLWKHMHSSYDLFI